MTKIILPGEVLFEQTVHSVLPPGWRDDLGCDFSRSFAVRAKTGLLEPMSEKELQEYLFGWEYDELEDDESSDTDY